MPTVAEVVVTAPPYTWTDFRIFRSDINISPDPMIPLDGPLPQPPALTPDQVREMRDFAACHAKQLLQLGKDTGALAPDNQEYLAGLIQLGDGTIVVTQWYPGGSDRVSSSQFTAELNYWGADKVIGLIHNHPINYTNDADVDRYPSGGLGPLAAGGNDWTTAQKIVSSGNDVQADYFTHYIIDTVGTMRAYEYNRIDFFGNMSVDDRGAGVGLPDPQVC